MDHPVADSLDTMDASKLSGSDAAQSPGINFDMENVQSSGKRRWRGLSALKAQASMQDKLLEK